MDLDQLEIEISVIYKGEKINVDISDEALESIQEDIELTYNEEHKEMRGRMKKFYITTKTINTMILITRTHRNFLDETLTLELDCDKA